MIGPPRFDQGVLCKDISRFMELRTAAGSVVGNLKPDSSAFCTLNLLTRINRELCLKIALRHLHETSISVNFSAQFLYSSSPSAVK